jgi:iron complex outermembrane receptor protein
MIFPGALAPPSNARSWEAGVKLEFFDGKLRATADYYDLTKTNVPTADAMHPGFSLLIGEARSKGPEVDIQGEISPGWSVIAAYTNQDVRVTKSDPSDTVLISGQRFPSVPRNLASLWTTYEFQDETLKGLKIGGGYTYHGSQPVAGAASTYPLLPSYGTVDLVTAYGFKMAGTKLTAQVNVTNLFNRLYYADGATFSPPTPGLQFPAGRSYGAPFAVLGSIRAEF